MRKSSCGTFIPFSLVSIIMNPEVADKLGELVKRMTETGEWVLDPKDLKVNDRLV
jgi:hypothetical protein